MVSHAISRLNREYALLLGKYEFIEREIEDVHGIDNMLDEIARIDREKAKLMLDLDHIAATAKTLDPSWQRERVRPIYPRKKVRKYGVMAKNVFAVLREAAVPLKTREIAKLVAIKIGIKPNERELARLDQGVYGLLYKKVGRTIQKTQEGPAMWALLPRSQVRSDGEFARQAKRAPRDRLPPLPRKPRRSRNQSTESDQQ